MLTANNHLRHPIPIPFQIVYRGLKVKKSSTYSLVIFEVCDKPKNVSLFRHICYYKTAVGKVVPNILVLSKYPQWSIFREIRHDRIWVWKCLTNVSRLGRVGETTSQILSFSVKSIICKSQSLFGLLSLDKFILMFVFSYV